PRDEDPGEELVLLERGLPRRGGHLGAGREARGRRVGRRVAVLARRRDLGAAARGRLASSGPGRSGRTDDAARLAAPSTLAPDVAHLLEVGGRAAPVTEEELGERRGRAGLRVEELVVTCGVLAAYEAVLDGELPDDAVALNRHPDAVLTLAQSIDMPVAPVQSPSAL